jgi:Txe/YoeB family toxin of Txe-Axe toxin-antitoxin module
VEWDVIFFRAPSGSVPGDEFLDACPTGVEADIEAVLDAVAKAPPPQFSGGGKWEAMRGSMKGYYEVRVSGPSREQFRLFCILENADSSELGRRGLKRPPIAVITGMRKAWRTTFTDRDYSKVRKLGDDHKSNYPRRIAE